MQGVAFGIVDILMLMASGPETRMIPIAPPGAVAMAAIVDMYSLRFLVLRGCSGEQARSPVYSLQGL